MDVFAIIGASTAIIAISATDKTAVAHLNPFVDFAADAFFFSNCEKSTSFLILSLTSGDFSYNSFIILFLFFIINLAVKRFDFFDYLVIFPVYRGYGFAKHFCDLDAAVSVNRREFQYAEFVVA